MLHEVLVALFLTYTLLLVLRARYFIRYIPRRLQRSVDPRFMRALRRQYFRQGPFKQLEIPFKTHIIPLDMRNVVVYDHISGFAQCTNKLLIVPDFGSVHSLTQEITIALDHFSDVYVLNPRVFAPFYHDTRPIHSRNTMDVEYLVQRLKVSKILALGEAASTREFSKRMLQNIRISIAPLEMTANKLQAFDRDREAHLNKNQCMPFNHEQRLIASNSDCYEYARILDRIISGDEAPQKGGTIRVFDVRQKVACEGGFQIVCACMWLNYVGGTM